MDCKTCEGSGPVGVDAVVGWNRRSDQYPDLVAECTVDGEFDSRLVQAYADALTK